MHTFEFHEERQRKAEADFARYGLSEVVVSRHRDVCGLGFGDELKGKVGALSLLTGNPTAFRPLPSEGEFPPAWFDRMGVSPGGVNGWRANDSSPAASGPWHFPRLTCPMAGGAPRGRELGARLGGPVERPVSWAIGVVGECPKRLQLARAESAEVGAFAASPHASSRWLGPRGLWSYHVDRVPGLSAAA